MIVQNNYFVTHLCRGLHYLRKKTLNLPCLGDLAVMLLFMFVQNFGRMFVVKLAASLVLRFVSINND
uniref:Uncharacterized protein n=1 Tax=Arundo donax TaxID=35708 RepID=A0A0A9FZ96_ARUDO